MARPPALAAMMHTVLSAICLLVCLFSGGQPASATTGGVTSAGAFAVGSTGDTGSRERVALVERGTMLVGRPRHGVVDTIALYAPGCDSGHVIVREVVRGDTRRSLLLTASPILENRVVRATIFIRATSNHPRLLESADGRWRQRAPQPLSVAGHDDRGGDLVAFVVDRLGSYWLVEGGAPAEPPLVASASLGQSARRLLGGSISRGLLAVTWGVLLLILGRTISRWLHATDQLAGK